VSDVSSIAVVPFLGRLEKVPKAKRRAFGGPPSNYGFTGFCGDYDLPRLRIKAITSVICWSVRPLIGFIFPPPSVICFFKASSDLL
jgi:hypothetical protein